MSALSRLAELLRERANFIGSDGESDDPKGDTQAATFRAVADLIDEALADDAKEPANG